MLNFGNILGFGRTQGLVGQDLNAKNRPKAEFSLFGLTA